MVSRADTIPAAVRFGIEKCTRDETGKIKNIVFIVDDTCPISDNTLESIDRFTGEGYEVKVEYITQANVYVLNLDVEVVQYEDTDEELASINYSDTTVEQGLIAIDAMLYELKHQANPQNSQLN